MGRMGGKEGVVPYREETATPAGNAAHQFSFIFSFSVVSPFLSLSLILSPLLFPIKTESKGKYALAIVDQVGGMSQCFILWAMLKGFKSKKTSTTKSPVWRLLAQCMAKTELMVGLILGS